MSLNSSTHQKPPSPAQRLSLELPVEFRRNYARSSDNGLLKNISLTGAFLETSHSNSFELEEKINVRFNVSGREREVIATIKWKNPEGCGVQFQPFNNRDVQIVDDLMYFVKSKQESRKKVLDIIFDEVS